MDYFQQKINICRDAIVEAYPTIKAEDLEYFWNGGLMEITRMMFRAKGNTFLFLVTYDELLDQTSVIKYAPVTNS